MLTWRHDLGVLQVLELRDRIAELCNRATTEKDPAALDAVLKELKASLAEYIRDARRMTLLHFNYFQRHQNLVAQLTPPTPDSVEEGKVKPEDPKDDVKREAS